MIEVNWHPWRTNPLNFVAGHEKESRELVAYNDEPVTISRSGGDFIVTVGDQRVVTGSNINTCYLLNQRGVGIKVE